MTPVELDPEAAGAEEADQAVPAVATPAAEAPAPSGAKWVAVGIMSSKVVGLLREMAYSRFLGIGPHTDVLRQAFKAPNLLANLLGEQTLSAAFIPIYSRMLEEGREEDAGRFAGAVFGLLVATVGVLVMLGVAAAPWIVAVLSPGFLADAAKVAAGEATVDRYALLVALVRIVFPTTGLMVMAAWTMGILNSHRRFFLPYMAPAFWNISILAALFAVALHQGRLWSPGGAEDSQLTTMLYGVCIGALVGGLLQFGVQVPSVLRVSRELRPSMSLKVDGVADSLHALGPALAGRGVVQLSLYIDMMLASFLAAGAPAAITFASTLFNLPLGVFGMSVAAAELPELSRKDPDGARRLITDRVRSAALQSSFLVVPSVVGYGVFGFLVVGLLYRGGEFGVASTWLVWAVLLSYTLGLPASTLSRLLQNSFFALRDTRTPAKVAGVRVLASVSLGLMLMLFLDRFSVTQVTGVAGGDTLFFGACGLALAASCGAWGEVFLLLNRLKKVLPELNMPWGRIGVFLWLATLAALAASGLWYRLREASFLVQAVSVLPAFAALYLVTAAWLRMPELKLWLARGRRGK